jgi:3-deoxy-manno-octulosonate cytidylyltransferase (CMP-KDO synthetase)
MASTRFPGKPLVDLAGKPMIQWVVEAAHASAISDSVIIATPDPEILEAAEKFGAQAILTRHDHLTGTDRLAELAENHIADVYINVQGDEPLIDPENIRAIARPFQEGSGPSMASLYLPCPPEEIENPAVVKVVTDLDGYALYFSRHPIPFERNARPQSVKKHVGLYAYRRDALRAFASWPPTPLEQAESLEQLRFLEHGIRIQMVQATGETIGIDTPDQAELARQILRNR